MSTRLLETKFKHGGFDYRQLQREGNVALFEQAKGGAVVSYEVVIVRVKPASSIQGRIIPEREAYPSNEEWGTFAWTVVRLEDAKERFNRLVDASQDSEI